MAEGTKQTVEFFITGKADLGDANKQINDLTKSLDNLQKTTGVVSTLGNVKTSLDGVSSSAIKVGSTIDTIHMSKLTGSTSKASQVLGVASDKVVKLDSSLVDLSGAANVNKESFNKFSSNMGIEKMEKFDSTIKRMKVSTDNSAQGLINQAGASKMGAVELQKLTDKVKNSSAAVDDNRGTWQKLSEDGFAKAFPKFSKLNNALTQIRWAFVTVAFAIAAVVKVIKTVANAMSALAKSAMEIESSIMKIQSVVGGTFDKLYSSVLNLREGTVFAFTEMSDAYLEFAKKGFTAEETMSALTSVSELAVASFTDLKNAVNLTAQILHAFNIGVEDADDVVSSLLMTVNKSALDLEGLKSALSGVAPVAAQAGFELNDVNAALGLLANKGLSASVAGTALKTVMLKLINPTGQMKEKMDSMGISFETAEGNIKSLNDLMLELSVATSRMNKFERFKFLSELGGRRGVVGLSALLSDMENGTATIDDFAKALEDGSYASVKSAGINATAANRIKSSWLDTISNLKELFRPLGDSIAGFAVEATAAFSAMSSTIVAYAGEIKLAFVAALAIWAPYVLAAGAFTKTLGVIYTFTKNTTAELTHGRDTVQKLQMLAMQYNVELENGLGFARDYDDVWADIQKKMASATSEIEKQDNVLKAATVEARQLAESFDYAAESLDKFIQGHSSNASALKFLDDLQEKTDETIRAYREASGNTSAYDHMTAVFDTHRASVIRLGEQVDEETLKEKKAAEAIDAKNKIMSDAENVLSGYNDNLSKVNKEIGVLSNARFTGQLGVEKLLSKMELWTKKQELAALGIADAQVYLNSAVSASTNDFDSFISSIQKVNELTNTGKDSYDAWRETVKEFIRETVSAGNMMGTNVSGAITRFKTQLLSTSKFGENDTSSQAEEINKLRLAYDVHYGAMTDDVGFAIQAQKEQTDGVFNTSGEVISALKEQWKEQETWTGKITASETAIDSLGAEIDLLTTSHELLNAQLEKTLASYKGIKDLAIKDITPKLTEPNTNRNNFLSPEQLLTNDKIEERNAKQFAKDINPTVMELVKGQDITGYNPEHKYGPRLDTEYRPMEKAQATSVSHNTITIHVDGYMGNEIPESWKQEFADALNQGINKSARSNGGN